MSLLFRPQFINTTGTCLEKRSSGQGAVTQSVSSAKKVGLRIRRKTGKTDQVRNTVNPGRQVVGLEGLEPSTNGL